MDTTLTNSTDDSAGEASPFREAVQSVVGTTRECWALRSDEYLPLESVIAVGLGHASLTRDGQALYEQDQRQFDDLMTVGQAEAVAKLDPAREWNIHLVGLLDDRHYRRIGDGRWRIYRRGYGLS